MKHQITLMLSCVCFALATALAAQVETLSDVQKRAIETEAKKLYRTTKGYQRQLLNKLPKDPTARFSALRTLLDAQEVKMEDVPLVHYTVPALSDAQYLPDAYPYNGRFLAPVRIIAAQDEYEPGSFLLYSFTDLGKAELKLTPLKRADGKVFPAEDLDLKVIKVWYQNKNGWYSYFGDQGAKLTPELLLNDEDLIKVDTKAEHNFARLTEKDGKVHYQNISLPLNLDSFTGFPGARGRGATFRTFRSMMANFRDAKTLQPVALDAGKYKQFFLTVHAKKSTLPGIYRGAIDIVKNGKKLSAVPVEVRVLDFVLPAPKTYFDVTRDLLVSSYAYFSKDVFLSLNGGDAELYKKQLAAVAKNLVRHNQNMYIYGGFILGDDRSFEEQIRITREAGMRTDPFIIQGGTGVTYDYKLQQSAAFVKKIAEKLTGHHNLYVAMGDEPPTSWLMNQRPVFYHYQQAGLKFFIAGYDALYHKAAYYYDWVNLSGDPIRNKEKVAKWNQVGEHANVGWYGTHHIGVENPSFNRRQNGLAPYLSNYSVLCNYAHHLGPWNDSSHTYRNMVLTYSCYDGIIDTLGWEGYREGIDDIRYATLLKTLALEANKSKNMDIGYAGRAALYFLSNLDAESVDQDLVRIEMIRHIQILRKLLGKVK